jgi:hypothetical protein
MTTPAPDGRFFCEHCLQRFTGSGDCPRCTDEPLLDLVDDEVRLMLEEFDSKAKMRRYSIVLGVIVVLTIPLDFLIFGFIGPYVGVVIAAGLVAALTSGVVALFPAKVKSPRLSDEAVERLRAQPDHSFGRG